MEDIVNIEFGLIIMVAWVLVYGRGLFQHIKMCHEEAAEIKGLYWQEDIILRRIEKISRREYAKSFTSAYEISLDKLGELLIELDKVRDRLKELGEEDEWKM